MIKIDKSKLNSFLKTPSSNGEATSATHKLSIYNTRHRGDSEIAYFEHFGEKEKDIKNNFFIDKKDDKIIAYATFRVKNDEETKIATNDIFIGFDGKDYLFEINDNIDLLTEKIKKNDNVVYSNFTEMYEEYETLPRELKFVTTAVDIAQLSEFHNNFKELQEIIKESELQNNVAEETIETIETHENKKSEEEKTTIMQNEHKQMENSSATIKNPTEHLSSSPQPVVMQTVQMQSQYIESERIKQFKLLLGQKLLKEKEAKGNTNFRNINYPTPTNPLEKAIFLNGGTKPILCYGQQGSGKSWTAEQYAKDIESSTGIPVSFYNILLEKNLDKADIVGSPVLKDDAFNYQKMAEAFMSARDGNLTVFLVDEIFRLKEMGTFFNLFGETHYKLDTGRQLEVVELITESIDGNLQTTHYCLSDRKILNPNMILEPGNIRMLKKDDDEIFKSIPEQKIKDRLALGEIPIIERKDYEKFGLEGLKVSSFYTSEQIKAPIENLIIIAAGNIGSEYQSHFKLDSDKAFRSRFAIVEQPAPELSDYLRAFKKELDKAQQNNYISWDSKKYDINSEKNNVTKIVETIFKELFKKLKQKSFSTSSNFSHRTFFELATNLCKQKDIGTKNIKECLMSLAPAILNHKEGTNSRIVVESDLTAYTTIIDTVLNGREKEPEKTKSVKNESAVAVEDIVEDKSHELHR